MWQIVALLGLIPAVAVTVAGGRHRRSQAVRKHAEVLAARARVTATTSHIRPLDPRVHTQNLEHELPRKVLGLFNGAEPETDAETNHVHQKAELILNHLGLVVDLKDVNGPLPDEEQMASYRGVLAWFGGQRMKHPRAYLKWLVQQIHAGRRVVLLDGLGASSDLVGRQTSKEEMNEVFQALGLEFSGHFTEDAHRIQVEFKDQPMVEFERPLPSILDSYEQYKLVDPAGKSYLRLRRVDLPDGGSDVVVVTPRGGFVAPSYAIDETRFGRNHVMTWRIDPFRFLAAAFGVERTARPDFTTLAGSRIFYSHIDGDGFPSITEVDYKTMCGDFVRTEILEKVDLPVTVSFVVAEVKPPPMGLGTPERLEAARRIAALPNVELGTHGLAHPMDWRARGQAVLSYDLPGYKMSAEEEIVFATRYIRDVINPPGKPAMVMLWTGWCNPAEDQLALAYTEGIYNLNGGDPRMDGEFPSYLHLVPPIHRVGKHRQYFTSGPNEYILTEEWQPPYHRWRKIVEMFERTEAPVRIVPMNAYYHYYIVEKVPALAAMKDVLDFVIRQEPAPLWVSQYIDVVRDFEDMRLARLDPGSDDAWRILNSGYCRTVRFDLWDRHVDLTRSRGVIGYRRLEAQRALYVHLDESHDHTVVLTPAPAPGRRPFVRRASSYVDRLEATADSVSFVTRGYGRKHLWLANMVPRATYVVQATNEAGERSEVTVASDAQGTLEWHGDVNGAEIKVRIQREGSGG
jgi:hypothetical protein